MSCIRRLLLGVVLVVALFPTRAAEEKKNEKKIEPPKITGALPFAIMPGMTNKIRIRGLSLTNATEVRFPMAPGVVAEIKSRGPAKVPDKADPKKLGETQLEVELVLPADFPAGDLAFFASTPDGDTNTNLLHVVERGLVFDEQEPNGGFRTANEIGLPQVVRGVIGEANDVDVFRFTGRAGQKVRVHSLSVRYGSTLDPILSLHDAAGRVLVTSDDTKDGLDARIEFTLPRAGGYFITVIDAHDRGGPTYGYLLVWERE